MDFTIEKLTLKYLTDTMAHLGEAVASPTKKTINAWDFSHKRFLSYSPTGAVAGKGRDIGVETASLAKISKRAADGTCLTITPEAPTMKFGNTAYRMLAMEPAAGPDTPDVKNGPGEITVQTRELRAALADAQTAGTPSAVIAITKDGIGPRAEGGGPVEGCILAPGAQHAGTGYSGLHTESLVKCVPDIAGLAAKILLSSKDVTMQLGDDITYYRGAAPA